MRRSIPLFLLVVGACSLPTGVESAPTAASVGVEADGFLFQPENVVVPVGGEVVFVNRDSIDHTVTAGTPEDPTGAFDISLPEQGATGTVVFETPGSFDYFCRIHTHMRGTVEAGSA